MGTSGSGRSGRARAGLPSGRFDGPPQWDTRLRSRRPHPRLVALALALLIVVPATTGSGTQPWPPFLPPRDRFEPAVIARVERVWSDPTLARTVRGVRARVPFEIYVTFVDTPELTAAAARDLGLARYEVESLGEDHYRATDNDGSRGVYRVLLREGPRRVILSWGQHSGSVIGSITGEALTVLDLAPIPDGVDQSLTAFVRIDNPLAARLARILVTIFGGVADRKLAEGFAVTARVAEWAIDRPDQFCAWLADHVPAIVRGERGLAVLPACAGHPRQAAS